VAAWLVVAVGRRVVVGALVVWVVGGSMVVGTTVTIEVTMEVTVTVRTGCSAALALPMSAPSTKPTIPSTQPRCHHGGWPVGRGGLEGGGVPQPLGGGCPAGCHRLAPPAGGIGSVGRSVIACPVEGTYPAMRAFHAKASLHRGTGQGPGKVAVCAKCPNMPVAGTWLPAWANAVARRRATT
jgi:hypothetical protein